MIMCMIVSSLMLAIIGVNISERKPEKQPVPEWVKKLFINKLSPLLKMQLKVRVIPRFQNYLMDRPIGLEEVMQSGSSINQPQQQNEEVNEWLQIATIMDCLLFWVFPVLPVLILTSFILLFVIPVAQRSSH